MTQAHPVQFRKVRDIGEVLTAALEFLREHFKPLGRALLFIVGPVTLVSAIIGAILQSSMFSAISGANTYDPYSSSYGTSFFSTVLQSFGLMMLLGILALMVVALTTSVVYTYIVLYMDRPKGEEITVQDVWADAKGNFGMLLLTFFGLGAIWMIASFMVALIPLLGILAIYIGGTYAAVTISMVPIIRIREKATLSESISRSFELIRNNWWRTFLLVYLVYILVSAILSILWIPQFIVMSMVQAHTVDNGDPATLVSTMMIILGLIVFLSLFLLYPLPLVTIAMQYFNLVERKEGVGLRERVEQFGAHLHTPDTHEPIF